MSKQVPQEVLDAIEPINHDMNYSRERARLVPYLLHERSADWRIRLVDIKGVVLAEYLQWQNLERHTVLMFLNGFEALSKSAYDKGQAEALNKLYQHQKQILGLK